MEHSRNITRYTYSDSSFQGWRLSMCRHHTCWHLYFPDREYGGSKEALLAAQNARKRALELLEEHSDHPDTAFRLCEEEVMGRGYPGGLRPRRK